MAQNSLFPGFFKMYYTVSNRQHVQTLPLTMPLGVNPGTPAENLFLTTQSVDISAADFATDWMTYMRPFMNTAAQFTIMEFWAVPSVGADPYFVTVHPLGVAGTSATATVPFSQFTCSFRTNQGGYLKVVMLDTVNSPNVRDDYPFSIAAATSLGQFMDGPNCPIIGRDGGFVIAPLRFITKTNDRLRKRGLLDS